MFIDSHCHLSFPELSGRIDEVRRAMADAEVDGALVRFLICGPMHWLGLLDLAASEASRIWSAVSPRPKSKGGVALGIIGRILSERLTACVDGT